MHTFHNDRKGRRFLLVGFVEEKYMASSTNPAGTEEGATAASGSLATSEVETWREVDDTRALWARSKAIAIAGHTEGEPRREA